MMSQKKQVTYDAINSFIIAIKCGCIEEIQKYLDEYHPSIVNRLQSQTRQPSLYFPAIMSDHELSYTIMKLLIDHGANAHFKDNYQQTILFYVCREGKEKCLDLLIEQGLNLDDQDIYGQTPLYYAAKEDRIGCLKKLINKKVNLNHQDKIAAQTALFYAAREGHLEVCKILVQNGCDIAHQDSQHKIASHYAKKANKNQVFDYLSNEYQNLKQHKRIVTNQYKTESNQEEKISKNKRKKQTPIAHPIQQVKSVYKLYRADSLGNSTQLNQAEFEQFLLSYPHLQGMFKNPEEIDLTTIEQIKLEDAWIKHASKALTLCWKAKGAYFFHQPVDPVKFGIEDYFQIILHPMDFGTIKRKLNFNVYNNIREFIDDVKLVFENCLRYNGSENQVTKYAFEIQTLFEENMKQAGYI